MRSIKRILKVMLVVALCTIIAVPGASPVTETTYAAETKPSLSVNFRGKTVELIKDIYGKEERIKVDAMEKKWGKPNKKEKAYANDSEFWYTWKKGKTTITVNNFTGGDPGNVGAIQINIKDKNASMCGVKVGIKKQKALKKLERTYGKEKVIVLKEGQQPNAERDENDWLIGFTSSTGEKTSNKEVIYVAMGYSPMQVLLTKSGVVKEISYVCS